MNKYSFHNNRDSIKFVIDRLLTNNNLSEWEKQFIMSIKGHYDFGKILTNKQLEKLSDLWNKY